VSATEGFCSESLTVFIRSLGWASTCMYWQRVWEQENGKDKYKYLKYFGNACKN